MTTDEGIPARPQPGVPRASPLEESRLAAVAVAIAAAAGLLALYLIDPAESALFSRCPFNALTGLYCPGCGSLRAIHHALHGRIGTAFGYNPLMLLAAPFVAYALGSYVLRAFTGRALPAPRARAWWVWALLAVILLFGVLRNVPAWPFRLLAPHG